MAKLNIYLTFNGNCEAAFQFYKNVFNVEFGHLGRFSDIPPSESYTPDPADYDRVMHVNMKVGENELMGSDCPSAESATFIQGNNTAIALKTFSREETEQLFKALSENGKVTMPLQDTFWGDYFGMFTDQFGIHWMLSYNAEEL